ncbi:MAG: type II/IV secretion system protein [Candidatus Omnitrophica bacterium]|nr:type II/IV secretion system protein [Candidatus Omnitrophota bacterium]
MAFPPQITREKLGKLLLDKNLCTQQQLDEALKQQTVTGRPLGEILIAFGFVKEKDVLEILSRQMQVPFFDLANFTPSPEALRLVPREYAQQLLAIPIFKTGSVLTAAMSDPLDLDGIAKLKQLAGCDINPVLSSSRSITQAIQKHYVSAGTTSEKPSAENVPPVSAQPKRNQPAFIDPPKTKVTELGRISPLQHFEPNKFRETESIMSPAFETPTPRAEIEAEKPGEGALMQAAREAPIIRKVNSVIEQAVREGASDIHFEPTEKYLNIRYRIDGILHKMTTIPKEQQDAMISRVKIMSEIDIAEKRLPQDGRIQIAVDKKDVDIRVSTFPTIYGESIVMRILIKSEKPPALSELGFSTEMREELERLIKRPNGIVLVTGPTGSGKTTTLYAALTLVNTSDRNIITLEDPVEYRLAGVRQSQIAPKAGLTFAQGLRAIVRQDPDVIMVGEIRDVETASIAIHAALTGHLVFSTLHTNDAPGAVARLVDMGIEPFLVASSVIGVAAQRLVRVNCKDCKQSVQIPSGLLHSLRLPKKEEFTYMKGKGCASCKMTGYRGRTVIAELMVPNQTIRQLIIEKATSERMKESMVSAKMPTLLDDGIRQVNSGSTTLEEVLRQAQDV